MTDQSLKQSVLDELNWEPSVKAAHIGVTARNGVVTLTGHVESYAEQWAAERGAERVTGVKAVAEKLEVRYPLTHVQDDEQIAKRAIQVLSWDVFVPKDQVKVKIENGWVTLTGAVDYYFHKHNAEADVRKLHGVVGVSNEITIKPSVAASDVRGNIKSALSRYAQLEAERISVAADGGHVTLSGHVDSLHERNLAATTAWSAPGVTYVENLLTVN